MKYAFVFLLLLGACANRQGHFIADGGEEADFPQARYECLREARTVVPGVAVHVDSGLKGFAAGVAAAEADSASRPRIVTDRELFFACMEAKGFRYVRN